MKLVGKAVYFRAVAIIFLLLSLTSARVIGGSFFFKPSSSQRAEGVFDARQFQFVITDTNFPQLSSTNREPLLLSFAMAPVTQGNLQAQGIQYSGYTSVTAEDVTGVGTRVPRIISRSNFLLGRNSFLFGVSSNEFSEIDRGVNEKVMPLWGLADFLLEPSVRNRLMFQGFAGSCLTMEPVLLGNQALLTDYLGTTHGSTVISQYYFFGNNAKVGEQYSVRIQSEPVEAIHSPQVPAPLPLERRHQEMNVAVQSNIRSLLGTLAPGSFFFVVGLTRSGKWGFLAVVLGKWHLEAVRKELWNSMRAGKKDFDSDPPGGGASGAASTPVR